MKKRTIIISVVVVLLAVATGFELFYFRFHTYFQRTEVQETLPPAATSGVPGEARTIVQGAFGEVDALHKGSGTARIVEQSGVRYLRLEDFEVTNGPDLYVYLSESKAPGSSIESISKYISLGSLKGNAGNQTYAIPENVRGYDTAIIWCQEFGVLFSFAVMQ